MTDERRATPRHTAHLAGEIETAEGNAAIAITRDLSAGGLLVLTRMRLAVGTHVKLLMLWRDERVIVRGTVLREEAIDPAESTLWRSRAAIAVDASDPALAKVVAALAEST